MDLDLQDACQTMKDICVGAAKRLYSATDTVAPESLGGIIRERLINAFPGVPVLIKNQSNLSLALEEEYCWLVDPQGISLALLHNRAAVAAALHLPGYDILASAYENSRTEISFSSSFPGSEAPVLDDGGLVLIDDPDGPHGLINRSKFSEKVPKADYRSMTLFDLVLVIDGLHRGCVYPFANPFEIAAGAYLAKNAGLQVCTADGRQWTPLASSLVAADTPRLQLDILDYFEVFDAV